MLLIVSGNRYRISSLSWGLFKDEELNTLASICFRRVWEDGRSATVWTPRNGKLECYILVLIILDNEKGKFNENLNPELHHSLRFRV